MLTHKSAKLVLEITRNTTNKAGLNIQDLAPRTKEHLTPELGSPQKGTGISEGPPNASFRQYLLNLSLLKSLRLAPVAKLDKAPVYETGDYRFESCRARHIDHRLMTSKRIRDPRRLFNPSSVGN
ncbi:uncharacterized protein METZ01_LOCUS22878 [marine metagenome]|uniref:Uncharacterized protein n=1 Tax=marine metagenome TaxID=408172 RepID=A0A381PTN8_9ZZZZ